MDLGQQLKQARLEAGLSQRQLCGDVITRNMLSQIENGSARPSMDTLRYLASRLEKPVSYFLQEDVPPRQSFTETARDHYAAGAYDAALEILQTVEAPDPEQALLGALCRLALAQKAIEENRLPYARQLLTETARAGENTRYYTTELERRRLLLLARAEPETAGAVLAALPEDELLLRARSALADGKYAQSAALLDACTEQQSKQWSILRGDACFGLGEYREAMQYYLCWEEACYWQLEQCNERLGDYKQAYYYACKQR